MHPVIAICGRPNVGKSTLFNRLIGRRSALVDPTPGVTRDRREGDARLGRLRFTAVDTAGLEETSDSDVESEMQVQTLRAIDEAEAVLLLFDARAGITPLDRHFADLMRKSRSPVILVANKCEARSADAGRLEAYELGMGEPIAIASEHGIGMPDLEDAIVEALENAGWQREPEPREVGVEQTSDDEYDPDGPLQLAIVGRPNVGKSTLVNALVGDERVITGDISIGPETSMRPSIFPVYGDTDQISSWVLPTRSLSPANTGPDHNIGSSWSPSSSNRGSAAIQRTRPPRRVRQTSSELRVST